MMIDSLKSVQQTGGSKFPQQGESGVELEIPDAIRSPEFRMGVYPAPGLEFLSYPVSKFILVKLR